ncbi:MAG: tetratricopeptide repeat protein [Symploca sp. SIO3E6]|nr:tetratricopeptide repeat protein [Caldora sp. SIO3E6]
MKKKETGYFPFLLLPSSLCLLTIVGCKPNTPLSPGEISQKIEESVVLIFYNNRGGNGSGFFVDGKKGVCTVLTARHVTLTEESLKIQTKDQQIWNAATIQRFPNHDLALVEFKPKGNNCSYPSLTLGDSDQVNKGAQVYVSGYFKSGGLLVDHFVFGNVTAIDQLSEGYGIAYAATTAGGMSGGPVVNERGEIIAIHGRSDTEIYKLAKLEGEAIPEILQTAAEEDEEDAEAVGSQTSLFKWGIPTNTYLANLAQVPKVEATESLTADDYYNQGNDLLAQDLYEEAIVAYDKALEIKPDYADAWYGRGFALHEIGKYQNAIASYDKAIEIKPDKYEAWSSRGTTLYELGKYQEAIASYDKAIEIKPDYSLAWYNRGVLLGKLGKYKDEITSYDQAIKIDNSWGNRNPANAWYNRGNVLSDLGKNQEAIASYDKALEIKPDKYEAWYNRGNTLNKLGKNQEVIVSYDKALEIKPDKHEAWYNRGNVLNKLGKNQEAIASYDKALEIKPDKYEAWYNRGNTLNKLGKNQEAIASYDKALEIKPDKHEAWVGRGIALDYLGKHQEALTSLDKAIEIKPGYFYAWNSRGVVLQNLTRYDEALESYEKAIQLDSNYQQAINNRKDLLEKLGR